MNEVAATISAPAIVMAVSLACCAVAAALGFVNLRRYRRFNLNERSDHFDSNEVPHISVCIPARNEELNIEACVRSVLANRGVNVEVLVYDDDSTDGTPRILAAISAQDGRVRCVDTQTLPMDWNGKQWGCERMGQASQGEWLLFTDADVRLSTDCLRTTWIAANASKCDLISTVPRQIIGTWMEDAIIPLIHFVLLSYLPMGQMRTTTLPAASAGCGQFLFVRKSMWIRSGGHAAFRQSMHDGIKLPRAVRSVGGRTDLFDGTQLAECRMYRTAGQVWRGFAKNAYEGLGSFALLLFITVIHIVGHVLPCLGAVHRSNCNGCNCAGNRCHCNCNSSAHDLCKAISALLANSPSASTGDSSAHHHSVAQSVACEDWAQILEGSRSDFARFCVLADLNW
ncbi:MAG: glycosyltransferase family 2 protein [Planctomycetota bacterium]|nr:glycosyltransferase family 2 protein [Planctomycetota bacterium]